MAAKKHIKIVKKRAFAPTLSCATSLPVHNKSSLDAKSWNIEWIMIWGGFAESSQEQSASIATRVTPTNVSTPTGASQKVSTTECGDDLRDKLLCRRYVSSFEKRNWCSFVWAMLGSQYFEDRKTIAWEHIRTRCVLEGKERCQEVGADTDLHY